MDDLVQQYRVLKAANTPDAREKLQKILVSLDNLFWQHTEEIFLQSIPAEGTSLALSKDDRLLADTGLLAPTIVEGYTDAWMDKLYDLVVRNTDSRVTFLTRWMERKLEERVFVFRAEEERKRSELMEYESLRGPEVQKIRDLRKRGYAAIAGLFENLPGFKPEIASLVIEGRLDDQIETMAVEQFRDPDNAQRKEQYRRLDDTRNRIFQQALGRADNNQQVQTLAALRKASLKIIQFALGSEKDKHAKVQALSGGFIERENEVKREFVRKTLKLLRNVIRLGIAGSGLRTTHSILTAAGDILSPDDVQLFVDSLDRCDPRLPGRPDLLIAPFRGVGFYDWDQNSIILPIVPTRELEESIVQAVANYRILEDSLSGRQLIVKRYKERHPKDYREQFIRDYRNWLLGVCRGMRGAMEDDSYRFFRQYIGPPLDLPIVPKHLLNLDDDSRKKLIREIRQRDKDRVASKDDIYDLAILYYVRGWKERTFQELSRIYVKYADDPVVCYSYAFVAMQLGQRPAAKQALRNCQEIAPRSLWFVLANELLADLK